jgi:hypothetical protein
MLTSHRTGLDICVLPDNVLRALCFMDALIKGLQARSHDVRLRNGATYAVVFDEEVQISFRDKPKRVATTSGSYTNHELVPTGTVCFRARINMNEKQWKDGEQPVERQLPAIQARLEREGQRLADQSSYFQKQREKTGKLKTLQNCWKNLSGGKKPGT